MNFKTILFTIFGALPVFCHQWVGAQVVKDTLNPEAECFAPYFIRTQKIETVRIKYFTYQNQKPVQEDKMEIWHFNTAGHRDGKFTANGAGVIKSACLNLIQNGQELHKLTIPDYGENYAMLTSTTYLPNKKKESVKTWHINDPSELEEYWVFYYDKDNDTISYYKYKAKNNQLVYTKHDVFNKFNQLSRVVEISDTGVSQIINTYTLNQIRLQTYEKNEKALAEFNYVYNKEGQITEKMQFDFISKVKKTIKITYTGNRMPMNMQEDISKTFTLYVYNTKGQLDKIEVTDGRQKPVKLLQFEYTYYE